MEVPKKLSKQEITKNINDHMVGIDKELRAGFEVLQKYEKSVSIFGSSHATPADPYYKQARDLASRIVLELGYSIVTGGGPGIMAGANLGAQEAHGDSIGFVIDLPNRQHINAYITTPVHFKYFFARKTILMFAAEAYIFFPGGYGTFDELFSILTLVQSNKIPVVPVILVGKEFWSDFVGFMKKNMFKEHNAITEDDLRFFTLTDDMDEVMQIIRKAPVSSWWESED